MNSRAREDDNYFIFLNFDSLFPARQFHVETIHPSCNIFGGLQLLGVCKTPLGIFQSQVFFLYLETCFSYDDFASCSSISVSVPEQLLWFFFSFFFPLQCNCFWINNIYFIFIYFFFFLSFLFRQICNVLLWE